MSIASVAAAGSAVLAQQIQKLQQAVPAQQTGRVHGHHHGSQQTPPAVSAATTQPASSAASATSSSLLDLLA
ncbi:hypothetical protein [Lichenicoccus roseus]|uniref:Uncharacterized protein n=1 Tax=Lichenicoccus roseus TaxID=2683649 RepID=A0A5R9JJF3_9PROT|nr:hypothetical protein [Lichenicoccus roseus]TLU74478.1 hypothetical protein FE263_04705 [Lichenicoccus roseus]